MRRDESLGLGAIHADDELLDRLARRDDIESFDGLEALLAQWTAQIDGDAEAVSDRTGPWGLRGRGGRAACEHELLPAVPRTVRVPVSRAAAIAGALVITMSGGGVAAALTGQDVPLMSSIVAKARPVAPVATSTSVQKIDDAVAAAVGSRLRHGQPQEARKIVVALQDIAGSNPDPIFAAQVQQLDQAVGQAEILAAGGPATTASPTDLPSVLALGPTTSVALGLPSSPAAALISVTAGPLTPTTSGSVKQPPVAVTASPQSTDGDGPRRSQAPSTSATIPATASGSGSSSSNSPVNGGPTAASTSGRPPHGTTSPPSGTRPTIG
ncbi:MAG: hypothetical protein Q4P32_13040, partial [Micrococcales bacterium]|nr:hypothetical protein [Micrococcales bacterium]